MGAQLGHADLQGGGLLGVHSSPGQAGLVQVPLQAHALVPQHSVRPMQPQGLQQGLQEGRLCVEAVVRLRLQAQLDISRCLGGLRSTDSPIAWDLLNQGCSC